MRSWSFPRELETDVVLFTVLMAPLLGLAGAVAAASLVAAPLVFLAGTPVAAAAAALYAHRRGAARAAVEDVALRAQALTLAVTALLLAL
jgi:uncharacterized membrane protein YkgB